jgi:hypothetical protein
MGVGAALKFSRTLSASASAATNVYGGETPPPLRRAPLPRPRHVTWTRWSHPVFDGVLHGGHHTGERPLAVLAPLYSQSGK